MSSNHGTSTLSNLAKKKGWGFVNPLDTAGTAVDILTTEGRIITDISLPGLGSIIQANPGEPLLKEALDRMGDKYRPTTMNDIGKVHRDIIEGMGRGLDDETVIENARKNSMVDRGLIGSELGTLNWNNPYSQPATDPTAPNPDQRRGRELAARALHSMVTP